ncbi:hypothetical protein [Herbidospora sp. NBRC 101105]|uniref:hypothetical protein n=1 Tax=Herbidospora sp. NBRC 101105 TaxID=3032195 RepID=UPI0024A02049|nr:hypothetical protein [Herbidospora sp. NBRC 101105]GLX98802.1 hypothetical protein Hesp01_67520 [Herbidospora sp. NBRC 101105]
MNRSAEYLSRGLLGAVAALGVYVAVAFAVAVLTFSLALLPILMLYTPFVFLIVGVVRIIVVSTTTRSRATLAFWAGWTLCPGIYLVILFAR